MGSTENREPRTLDELLRQRAATMPDTPIAAYPTSAAPDSYERHTARQLDEYATRAAHRYRQAFGQRARNAPEHVVALLAASDLDYLVALFALGRLGLTPLLLSTRLSPEAIVSLLEKTGCDEIVHSASHRDRVEAVGKLRPVKAAPLVSDYRTGPVEELRVDLDPDFETKTACNILHSSGSTGFPKPIRNIHKNYIYNASFNLGLRGFITLPLYHNHGLSSFLRALHSGKVLYFYNPNLPLSARQLTAVIKHLGAELEVFYGVPYALKVLGTDEGLHLLKAFKVVMFGGSACPDDLGDMLVEAGVNLVAHYGATEVGQLMTSNRPPGDKEWNWLRPPEALLPYLRWNKHGDAYECVIADGWKSKVVSNQPDGSYATRDLFVFHPTRTDRFKYVGRLDDWLALVNGEKINPVQFEQTVLTDARVAEAVVFGAGQVAAGLVIVAAKGYDDVSEDEFIKLVQPTIDAANARAEAYAKIDREHIRVMRAEAINDCPKTDKGTVIRAAFYKKFEALIRSVYEDAERATDAHLALDHEGTVAWLRQTVADILDLDEAKAARLAPETDFFAMGLDSLGAYRVFSRIVKTLDLGPLAGEVGGNVCFEYPNVAALASFLSALRSGGTYAKRTELEEMQALIDRYGGFSPARVTDAGAPRVVLLTGATGSLGAHILATLLQVPTVEKVYCLNRGSDPQARTLESLKLRGLAVPLERVESLSADLTQPGLGVDPRRLAGVNLVIHNAWSVNFNMGVASFEPMIRGARNLIDLSFQANARYFFVSSVSSAVRSGDVVTESHVARLTDAQEMGYSRSKLVAERLAQRAHAAGLDARVLRIGQIVGDTRLGQWNDTEAIPLMIRSAVSLGALPTLGDTLTWLPIDVVAKIIVELCQAAAHQDVYNLVNPRSFNWTRDLLPMLRGAGLSFEPVTAAEWLARLAASNPDPAVNPTIKLLDFYRSKYAVPRTGPAVFYETKLTEAASPSLRAVGAPDAALIGKMVRYWTEECWK
ncbi:MAG TPA: SDR family oxidoreductase [Polyangia bacterium]|nr:SDR family oxidoreductase [Polyangia bacterium]